MELNLNNIRLVHTDCLALLRQLPDDSVDLIAVDPPYFRVVSATWDHQWKNKADFFAWLRQVLAEYQRVLKPSGSVYLFCGPYLAAQTELVMAEFFTVLNHIVWRKNTGRWLGCNKESLTKFFPQTERIIFAESAKKLPLQKKPFHFEPIRKYLDDTVRGSGITSKQVDVATGTHMSGHWFGRSQFSLPSEKHYRTLQQMAPALKPYAELRAEYKAIRAKYQCSPQGRGRSFAVTKSVPYTDVWDFDVVNHYPGKHPCEKPAALMEHILSTSSKPGDLVLDTFLGSGATALAAERLGRHLVGCELGQQEYAQASARLYAQVKRGAA
ncbi:DNA-methyltransferase (plasmid) [Microbulbifer sp. ANSA001]|uniref:DNA-methyltransferase n=1 Tax=Microbulbifer sp. ANSA001 TaxID=3243358 RepID=UPI00404239DE